MGKTLCLRLRLAEVETEKTPHVPAINQQYWNEKYPWGIQRLVSTHQLLHKSVPGRGKGVLWTNWNPKSLNLAKFSFLGMEVFWTNWNPRSLNLATFSFLGVGVFWTNWNPKSVNLANFFFISGGGGHTLDQFKSNVPSSDQIFIWEGVTLDQLKSKVQQSGQVYMGVLLWTNWNPKSLNLGWGGHSRQTQSWSQKSWPNFHWGGTLDTTFLKYLSGGTQGIWSTKFWQLECGSASQIVSHTN